ncbi:MAG: hypothetical protein RMJ43_11275 [Chloroherpetonaceae bacterium]|nr:hypothetical protein [Chthonomonadaceae bacterium]MDW8208410.1 hypothetical protein [Chloroherpetonaceae bacterium]
MTTQEEGENDIPLRTGDDGCSGADSAGDTGGTVREVPPEEADARARRLPVRRAQWARAAPWQAFWTGVAFALIGGIMALPRFADAVLPHILNPEDPARLQEIMPGVPLSHLLAWPDRLLDALILLQEMRAPVRLGVTVLMAGIGLRLLIGVINPTFRLFGPGHWEWRTGSRLDLLLIVLEVRQLRKAGIVLLGTGLPVGLLLWAMRSLAAYIPAVTPDGRPGLLWALRLGVLGATLWLGMHCHGLAGHFNRPRLHWPRGNLSNLLMTGALCGLTAGLLLHHLAPPLLEPRLTLYQTLGTFHRGYFAELAGGYFAAWAGTGFAIGALLYALGRPCLTIRQRGLLLGWALPGCLLAWAAERPFTPQALAARLDITPAVLQGIALPYTPRMPAGGVPNTRKATQELARRLGLTQRPGTLSREVLILDSSVRVARQNLLADDGLLVDDETVRKVRDFLQRRRYRSALSWVATRYLYNAACVRFRITDAIAACLDDQEYGPHMIRTAPPLREMLFTCAASPENLALLNRLADGQRFVYPDRESLRMMGDLYRRFGVGDRALQWYRRAEMPRTFLNRIRAERPMFHQGRIEGRILLNGRPLAGTPVGAIPIRLNGLPPDLEARLLNASDMIAPSYLPPGRLPRFDAYRTICASSVTDAAGAFTLQHLVEGEYLLAIALPASDRLRQWKQERLLLPRIVLNYTTPRVSVGTIRLEAVP